MKMKNDMKCKAEVGENFSIAQIEAAGAGEIYRNQDIESNQLNEMQKILLNKCEDVMAAVH